MLRTLLRYGLLRGVLAPGVVAKKREIKVLGMFLCAWDGAGVRYCETNAFRSMPDALKFLKNPRQP